MSAFKAVLLAFSVFSRIPVPKADWNDKNMRYMLAFFPLVGIVIGALVFGWGKFAMSADLTRLLFACGALLIPAAVTGGIHLDGLCNTADAIFCHAGKDKRREVLDDTRHVGSAAVTALTGYMLLYFALVYELKINSSTLLLLGCTPLLSRILASAAMLLLPADPESGKLHSFAASADKTAVFASLIVELVACETVAVMVSPIGGGAMLFCGAICFLLMKRLAQREFDGLRGDIVGYFLQMNELCSIACIVIIQKLELL